MGQSESAACPTAFEHVDCLGGAAIDLFTRALGQRLVRVEVGQATPACDGVIIAMVSLIGDVDWSVFLGFPRHTAMGIASAFAGFDIPFESEDMPDAIGELTNIYVGLVKSRLDARGAQARSSLPDVMRGGHVRFLAQSSTQCRKWCYNSGLGRFWTGVVSPAHGG
ncbi:MAG: chemotaxis protein CheX [Planctomycetota bacterium]